MRHIIVGTAGHIDHGKSALVLALTGTDPDRLAEEKRRGISIELGFAHLELAADVTVSFVDVPGHERFVKTMLAGATGIDLVLLVVAADESIKPQTREHFDICRLLAIPRGIVVLTKTDLVDEELLSLVRLEIEEFVAGSFLEGAPVAMVSAKTGQGISALKDAIARMARAAGERDVSRPFRLPVDRSFSMRGFGTVATGTLISGRVSAEDEVEVYPGGRKLRVRGVQVHGAPANHALAGQRTALNLTSCEPAEVPRGVVLAAPGAYQAAARIDCRVRLLAGAPPLKHRAPVHFHAGTAEVVAEVRLLEGGDKLTPGGEAFARILLRDPLLVVPQDRFILRMFSPVVTIGGGVVLDIDPPRRGSAGRLRTLEHGSPAEKLALVAREEGFGMSLQALRRRLGWTAEELERALPGSGVRLLRLQGWLIDEARIAAALASVREVLAGFHREHPLLPGIQQEEVRGRALAGAPAFLLETLLAGTGDFVSEGETLRLASHSLSLKQDEEQALERMEGAFRRAGLAVPGLQEVLAKSGVETARSRSLLQILLRQGRLVRISEDLVYHPGAIEDLRRMLAARKGQRFAVPAFKEWTGISRKYAIPLLEYLDRIRVTRRTGDERTVL